MRSIENIPGSHPGKEKPFFINCLILAASLICTTAGSLWLLKEIAPAIFNTK